MNRFAALAKLEDALSSLTSATEHEISSVTEAYAGTPFRSFAQAQFAPIASILTNLSGKQQERMASVKQALVADAALKKDVNPLKAIHSDIRETQKKHADLVGRLDKAVKVTASADEKYEKMKAKNPASPETRRLMNERDIQRAKSDAIEGEVQTSEKNLKMSEVIYKKQLFESLMTAFQNFANARKAQAEVQQGIAREIAQLGASVREHTEPVPESIRTEVEAFRAVKLT
jgi:hypothetical protein